VITGILVAVLVIGVLIAVHEFGHFVFAKLFGVGVERFSIGFGPALFSKKMGETEYVLSLVPLGGYVKMAGEGDNDEKPVNSGKSFDKKPVWKRIVICLAGPVFNILFALVLIVFANLIYGIPTLTTKIGGVVAGSPAEKSGLVKGDIVIGVEIVTPVSGNGFTSVWKWEELTDFIKNNEKKELIFFVLPKGMPPAVEIHVVPELKDTKNLFGESEKRYVIGIQPADPVFIKDPVSAVPLGVNITSNMLKIVGLGFWKLMTGQLAVKDSLGGPILIGQAGSNAYSTAGFIGIMFFTAIFSINLGILNLLPIPMLDGGYIPFLLIEAVRGKPVSIKTREKFFRIGLAILLLIMAFAVFNDISRIFSK